MDPRRRHLIAILLALLALATRWPLRSQVLDEYDSANYALALGRFSLPEARPHPPGYIFFVWAARAAEPMAGDPVSALTAVSAASGAVSIGLLFELLAPVLGPFVAATACLASMFSTQVWLQHVRPMQDSFALAWMLAAALALRSAAERGTMRAWAGACAFVGFAAGAKQILPVLMAGLIAWAARGAWARFGARALVTGAGAAALGSLAWVVPLAILCGSPVAYVKLALSQVEWQQENEAALFRPEPARLREQAAVTFVAAFGSRRSALPVWALAVVGALAVRRREAAWLLWLVLPLIALRLLLLGLWPRFALYYVPLVIALAVQGLSSLAARALRPPVREVVVAAACAAWSGAQVRYVLPTLQALHRGQGPVDRALAAATAAFPREDIVVAAPKGLLGRFVLFHAEQRGIRHAIEPRLPDRARHVVAITNARAPVLSSWASGAELLGRWHLEVPRLEAVTLYRDVWEIAAHELRGPQVAMRRWRTDTEGRVFATPLSRIVIFRPPSGFTLRLRGRALGPLRFVIAGRRTQDWDGRGEAHEVPVAPGEGSGDRIGIDVVPLCDDAQQCFELREVQVAALAPVAAPR